MRLRTLARRLGLGLGLGLALPLLAGCQVTANGPSVSKPTVVQHTKTVTMPEGSLSVKETVSCGAKEVLLSGGYDSNTPPAYGDYELPIEDSYPSDAAGNHATQQGQIMDSWTIDFAVLNGKGPQTVTVSVDCLAYSSALSSVWSKAFSVHGPSGPLSATVNCPDPSFKTLTGGGYWSSLQSGNIQSSWPLQTTGVAASTYWKVAVVVDPNGTTDDGGLIYAVCLTKQTQQGLVQAAKTISNQPYTRVEVGVSCPAGQSLTGGGFNQPANQFVKAMSMFGDNTLTSWHAATFEYGEPTTTITAVGVCVTLG